MLRFHQSESASDAKAYYTKSDYYLDGGQETIGEWGGRAASRLGLTGQIDRTSFERLCDNLHPTSGEPLTARTRSDRTVGNDITFDCPKSVSLLYELTGDDRLRVAFRSSVQETMRELEADAQTRVRKGGVDGDRTTGNLVWAEFIHTTSRPVDATSAPDPQLHAHCFTFNATWDPEEKQWKAVQFRDLRRDAPYWEAAFQQRLAVRLEHLGFEVTRKGRYFELDGVPSDVIGKFSRRTKLIEAEARARGIVDPEEKGQLGAKTRQKKAKELSLEQLRTEWVSRLTKPEFDALADVKERAEEREGRGGRPERVTVREALTHAADHCFERRSSVAARELIAEALRYGVGAFGVEDAWKHLESDGRFTAEVDGRLLVASRDVWAEEQRMVAMASRGRASVPAINPEYVIRDHKLNVGQRTAVHELLGSRDRVTMVIGDAGVGKTTALKEAVRGANAAGVKVQALAPSAEASRGTLRGEGFKDAETVARFLVDRKLQEQTRGQVVMVDEAGLLGTKDTAKLLAIARDLDTRVWLVGDDKQHKSVARGETFALLQEKAGLKPARITEVMRQRGEYRKAVELVRDNPRAGFDKFCDLGWVQEVPTEDRYQRLAADYVVAARQAKSGSKEVTALIIAPTHAEGDRVTAEVRNRLRSDGRLGEEREFERLVPLHLTEAQRRDQTNYRSGDVLQFEQNAPGHGRGQRREVRDGEDLPLAQADRFQVYRPEVLRVAIGDRLRLTHNGTTRDGHRVNNGEILTVRGFTAPGDIIDQRGWVVSREFGHLSHGYVTTSVSAQSRTVDRVLVAMGTQSLPAVSREQLYVSLSRGRDWAKIYTDDRDALRQVVGRTDDRVSATEVAARRQSRLDRWRRQRRHVMFLQRRVANEPARRQPAVDRPREQVAEQALNREQTHER
ncbi:MobF family relaxase [Fimbriiglobus ruber]|uniref:IncW plasmid conjugative relaxase protein TrwC (TraI) n=1 Tax=Fimbriiglobus ruber TaxID=1908690 RepID=A0A225DW13_9BACT|nr:MobF family relaxase [Fimbriiglobus ruber]OWK45581.1 IncW plasmid conjugative relaxase protein TrwC (TraI) [Fimbriiglobus ruber]